WIGCRRCTTGPARRPWRSAAAAPAARPGARARARPGGIGPCRADRSSAAGALSPGGSQAWPALAWPALAWPVPIGAALARAVCRRRWRWSRPGIGGYCRFPGGGIARRVVSGQRKTPAEGRGFWGKAPGDDLLLHG